MRKLLVIFALFTSLSFAAAPVAMAQGDVDIDVASDAVMDANLDTLMADLQTPPADDQLPDGFSNATFADPESGNTEEGVLPASDLEGAEGSVAYSIDWDPTSAATPETDTGGDPAFAVRMATLNYIFIDDEITSSDFEDFKSSAEQGYGGDASPEAGTETNIDTIQVNGTDAILLSYVINDEGVQSVVQMIALPVGNTMVVSMLVEAGAEVDQDATQTSAEDLVLSGADYLGVVATDGSRTSASNARESKSQKNAGPLEIIDVTSRDAGIGDGSLYVYIDVRNTTNKTLDYVEVQVICRGSDGRVAATGIGNTLNLGAGQSTVLTAIVLSPPACDSLDVTVDPLTGGF